MKKRKMKFSGSRLRDIRQIKGISQLKMSNDCGLNQSLVSKYERGEVASPPHYAVEAMARYLGVDADDFYENKFKNVDWTLLGSLRKKVINFQTDEPFTQCEVAKKANCSQAYIARIERGDMKQPDDVYLKAIASALRMTLPEFLKELKNSGEKAKRPTEQTHRVDVHVHVHFHTGNTNDPQS